MAGVGPMTQDWEPVVIRKKTPNAAAKRNEKTVNAARRSGPKSNPSENVCFLILLLDLHERVPTELKKAIMQARGEKKLTQSQLAQLINEKPQGGTNKAASSGTSLDTKRLDDVTENIARQFLNLLNIINFMK
ncbi:hypothetical protein Bca4012_023018 [Brassica carinata]|uniref:Multiprotein bridging factor 1 N-terminal domain-containing protein n=1 Tax=Brassica carinata TaxID=52824 RepID=A0A8X7P653_BRACI|nr:hypothetical protein Bca52824_093314 [Brassica carinata]